MEGMKVNQIMHGDCLRVLRTFSSNVVDSVVTDPPYGLSREPDIREVLEKWLAGEDYTHRGSGFMGKTWDSFVPGPSIWREVYRVLKPGGHALVFAGTRTQDLMTIALRLAGFEVRDVIEWLYFSGFPKSMDVSKAFDKRAGVEREVIGIDMHFLRRNPISNHKNDYGEGYGNPSFRDGIEAAKITAPATPLAKKWDGWGTALKPAHEPIILMRKPLIGTVAENVEQFGTGAINIDGCRVGNEERINQPAANKPGGNALMMSVKGMPQNAKARLAVGRFPTNCVTTEPNAFFSKYFNITPPELCKKASKRDRNSDWRGEEISVTNRHPTVKPTDLMAWLVRLVTPPGGIVLDPFAGSGSTCVAARREGFFFIGIEQELEYIEIARKRVGEIDTVLS